MYYSQVTHEQDKYLNENVFKNKKNGVFIDIGAYNGVDLSNTFFFEKELNWSGICFEPIKDAFELLCKNRKCKCINACVSDKDGEVSFLQCNKNIEMLKFKDSNEIKS